MKTKSLSGENFFCVGKHTNLRENGMKTAEMKLYNGS